MELLEGAAVRSPLAGEVADLVEATMHGGLDPDLGRVLVRGAWAAGTSTVLRQTARQLRDNGLDVRAAVAPSAGAAIAACRADRTTGVLVLDDVHLIDPADADALRDLVLNSPVGVVAGARDGTRLPEPLEWLITSGAIRVVQTPRAGVEELASLIPGGERVHQASAARLVALAGARIGFVVDLLAGSTASGSFCRRNGLWRLTGAPDVTGVRVRVARELDQLTPAAAEVARLAAAAGLLPPRALPLLDARAVDELDERGLVARAPTGLSLIPPVLVTVLQSDAVRPPPAIAEALLGTDPRSVPARLQVRWCLLTGTPISEAALTEAAEEHWGAGEHVEALQLLDRLEGTGPVLRLKADLLAEMGDRLRAVDALQELARTGTAQERQAAALDRAAITMWDIGRRDQTATLLRFPVDPEPPDLLIRRALLCLESGEPAAARSLLEPLARTAVPMALSSLGILEAFGGDPRRAVALAQQARESSAASSPSPDVAMLTYIEALRIHGDLGQARELGTEYYRQSLGMDRSAQAWAALMSAQIAVDHGDLPSASGFAAEAVELFSDLDQHALLRWSVSTALMAASLGADESEVVRWSRVLDDISPSGVSYIEPDAVRAQAWAQAARGDVTAARELLHTSAEMSLQDGLPNLAAEAWHDLVRLDAPEPVIDVLATRDAASPSCWSAPRARHARALADRDPAMLLDAAEDFWAMGARLVAAEAALKAAELARHRCASTARRANGVLRRWNAPRYLSSRVVQRQARLMALTAREREVCELAVGGLTNRQVAERLGIAPRTAQNLLHRAYQKLGIHDREGLRNRLGSDLR